MVERLNSNANTDDVVLEEGAFDLLLMLTGGPKSFIELKKIGYSPNTVLAKLRRLQDAKLVASKLFEVKKDRRPRIKYILTPEGEERIKRYMPIKTDYIELRRAINSLEEKIGERKQAIRLLLTSMKRAHAHK